MKDSKENQKEIIQPQARIDGRGFQLDKSGQVKCPSFPYPPMCFSEHTVMTADDYHSSWKRISKLVLGDDQNVPIKKMLLKAK